MKYYETIKSELNEQGERIIPQGYEFVQDTYSNLGASLLISRDYTEAEIAEIESQKRQAEVNAQKQQRISEIRTRLTALSEDIVQDQAGEVVPDIEARKAEFVALHNELRGLLGLEPREVKE